MHPNPRRILPVVLVLTLTALAVWYFGFRPASADDGSLTGSGTIEANQIAISPEIGGRVAEVLADEGQTVSAGDVLIRLEAQSLRAQLAQAQAAVYLAQANYDLIAAGMSAEQRQQAIAAAELEVLSAGQALDALQTQTSLTQAQLAQAVAAAEKAVDSAQTALDRLPSSAEDVDVALAESNLDLAQANLEEALRKQALWADGPDPDALALAEARLSLAEARLAAARSEPTGEQLAVAAAQVEQAQAALTVLQTQVERLEVHAPQDGTVVVRAIDPGEVAQPGAPLLTIAQLDDLTLTVYIAEDRYGQISLGQQADVTVDSFPGQVFPAEVSYIASQAEFTPRNVQTPDGRRTTVFAVQLTLNDPEGRLKPGMPADVVFLP